ALSAHVLLAQLHHLAYARAGVSTKPRCPPFRRKRLWLLLAALEVPCSREQCPGLGVREPFGAELALLPELDGDACCGIDCHAPARYGPSEHSLEPRQVAILDGLCRDRPPGAGVHLPKPMVLKGDHILDGNPA